MSRVLIADPLEEAGIEVLSREAEVDVRVGLSPEQLCEIIGQYDGLIVRSGTKVTRLVIESAHRLKVVGRAGIGVDNIDVEAATEKGIFVVNAPSAITMATAEHTFALLLSLLRKVPQAWWSVRSGEWRRTAFVGHQLRGKTIGIIGLGRIGSAVAQYARAFGMKVIATDPFITSDRARQLGIELKSLDDLLKESDVVTLHLPLTNETRHLLNERAFSLMKEGAFLINTARGGIVDEEALYRALTSGKLAGAALDVLEQEPPPAGSRSALLAQLENVIVTPHLGASAKEAQEEAALEVAQQVLAVLQGGFPSSAVNLPPIPGDRLEALRPFMDLGSRMGRVLSQLCYGEFQRVELTYQGQIAEETTDFLTRSFLKGFMEIRLPETVTYVNAPTLARHRGIRVLEEKSSRPTDYVSLVTATVHTSHEVRSLAGTVFQGVGPRLVRVDGYRVDVAPEGYAIFVEHIDRPGIIGRVGTLLGNNQINIAFMEVGRQEMGGRAVMVIVVDSPVPSSVLQDLKKAHEAILDARYVDFGRR
ncbi:MAG: phosphoglycerate dehydrogenase [Armatimonadetes bacterium]|nr:phosphoglycerate dehydrogenase [Armatimonadota bacterium]MDW8121029.1 phosphoglycerate dehydrogenase [Armatimonadota bacterium]